METPSGWPSITLMYLAHTLELTLKVSRASGAATIRLLVNDLTNRLNLLQGLSPLAASSDNALAAEGTTELSMDEKFSALQVWTGP